MSMWSKVAKQFGKPEGILGNLAGFIMANRSSNVERINWAIKLLNLKSTDNILEIGYGPGIAINIMSKTVKEGKIIGIDHSKVMYNQAYKRNIKDIKSGKIILIHDSISNLQNYNYTFDKILDINTFQFWENHFDILANLYNVLNENGTIEIVHQPRKPGATDADTRKMGEYIFKSLNTAGFKNIKKEIKDMKPVSTIYVTGQK